jgi:hypothetical protein
VLAEEKGIATCEIYGTRGQAQHGIDVLARIDGGRIAVGQCRRYPTFTAADIRGASDEFFAAWSSRWSTQNVRRYILFVSCDLSRTELHDEIARQVERFRREDIEYEAWGAATLARKLRPHRAIVERYIPGSGSWADAICGASPKVEDRSEDQSVIVSAALTNQLMEMAKYASDLTTEQADAMRVSWREGRRGVALDWARSKRSNSQWSLLTSSARAKITRFLALLLLDEQSESPDLDALVDEARALENGEPQRRLEALVEYVRNGPAAAAQRLVDPTELDSLCVRAALELELGTPNQSGAFLDRAAALSKTPSAEVHRIRSLLLIERRELAAARLEAQKALEIAPSWEHVRITAAQIDYLSSLSPAIVGPRIPAWPEPVSWDVVKRDADSLARLARAGDTLRTLAGIVRSRDGAERGRSVEGWALACVANDPHRQEEAATYCRSLLSADPAHGPGILWAITRELDVDLASSELALELAVSGENAEPQDVLVLVALYHSRSRFAQAVKLLEDRRGLFREAKHETAWRAWLAESLALAGSTQKALELLQGPGGSDDPELATAKSVVLEIERRESGDPSKLLAHITALHERSPEDAILLFQACRLGARLKRWAFVFDRAEALLSKIATPEALRIASYAAANEGHHEKCLAWLNQHAGLFEGALPMDLRRLRLHCMRVLGGLNAAISEAEAIARDEPTIGHLLELIGAYASRGDMQPAANTAQALTTRSDLSAKQALEVAGLIRHEDVATARELLRFALRTGVPDELVANAVTLASQLDIQSEASDLVAKMQALGREGRGGVHAVTLEELLTLLRQRRESQEWLEARYRAGELPVHVFSDASRTPLATLFHEIPAQNAAAPDPTRIPSLFTRHGGRPTIVIAADPPPRLHMDVTAFLMAAHFDLLDLVERTFAPVRVPHELVAALLEMRNQVAVSQPGRMTPLETVLRSIEVSRLQLLNVPANRMSPQEEPIVALIDAAAGIGAKVVSAFPIPSITGLGFVNLTPEQSRSVVNLAEVLETLKLTGPLSTETCEAAFNSLGIADRTTIGSLDDCCVLVLAPSIAEALAGAGVLDQVLGRFRCFVVAAEAEHLGARRDEDRRREELREWLGAQLERLRRGLTSGSYESMPAIAIESTPAAPTNDSSSTRCLHALMAFRTSPGTIIWIDDRFLNAYVRRDDAWIVDATDVLYALRQSGALSPADYFRRLNSFRAATVLFLPLDSEEILHALAQASIEGGGVADTSELRNLRRYTATALLRRDTIQRPPRPAEAANPQGEVAFLVRLQSAITAALVSVFEQSGDDNVSGARANWILSNLFFDLAIAVPRAASEETSRLVCRRSSAADLSSLIFRALDLHPALGAERLRNARRYLTWLHERVVGPRLRADPELLPAVVEMLKGYLYTMESRADAGGRDLARDILVQSFVDILPEPIRDALIADTDFANRMNLVVQPTIEIGGLRFSADQFIAGVAAAVSGRESSVPCVAPREAGDIVLRSVADEELGTLEFTNPIQGIPNRIAQPVLGLAHESVSVRESVLRNNPEWFDGRDRTQSLDALITDIATMDSARRRIDECQRHQATSYPAFLRRLENEVGGGVPKRYEELLPSTTLMIARYLRMPVDPAQAEPLAESCTALLAEFDVNQALDRFFGIPSTLPRALLLTFDQLPAERRREIVQQRLGRRLSLPEGAHVIHLLLRCRSDVPGATRLARRIVRSLVSEQGLAETHALLTVARWVESAAARDSDWRSMSAQSRLATVWTHARRLLLMFTSLEMPVEWIVEVFQSGTNLQATLFDRDRSYAFDIARPAHVQAESLLAGAMHYALGDSARSVLDDAATRSLVAALFDTVNERLVPHVSLLIITTHAFNSLGSFLSHSHVEDVLTLLRDSDDSSESAASHLEGLIASLETDPRDRARWLMLRAVSGRHRLPQGLWARLAALLGVCDFEALARTDGIAASMALLVGAVQCSVHEDRALAARLSAVVHVVARGMGDGVPNDGLELLVETILTLAAAYPSLSDATRQTLETLDDLISARPSSARLCGRICERIYDELPPDLRLNYGDLLLTCRARR